MLKIIIGATQSFDEVLNKFVTVGGVVVELEHSLVSLSKWEAKYEKPFLSDKEKTPEEIMDYVQFMIVTPDTPPEILSKLSEENVEAINTYITSKQTATWFNERGPHRPNREVITSELIYYWMFAQQIPIEVENWHISRILTLLRVFSAKNEKPKKMSPSEAAAQRRELNAARRAGRPG